MGKWILIHPEASLNEKIQLAPFTNAMKLLLLWRVLLHSCNIRIVCFNLLMIWHHSWTSPDECLKHETQLKVFFLIIVGTFLIEKTESWSTAIAIKFVSGLRFILFDMSHHEYVPFRTHESFKPQIALKLVSASNNIQICGRLKRYGIDQQLKYFIQRWFIDNFKGLWLHSGRQTRRVLKVVECEKVKLLQRHTRLVSANAKHLCWL